jgi:hypothetical protein
MEPAPAERPEVHEIDHRSTDGLEISLLWNETSDELSVRVLDSRTGESFELPAAKDDALDVFHHPYAYAAFRGLDFDGGAREARALRLVRA